MTAADRPVERPSRLRVGGREPSAPANRSAGGDAAPTRSVPVPGGGFDRVGGSRLTGPGAVLLGLVVVGFVSPPASIDSQLYAVVWSAALAVLLVGVAVPLVLVRRVQVAARSPRDAVVGEELGVQVTLGGRSAGLEVRALDPTGPWHRAEAPGTGEVRHLADRRGLFPLIRIEVRVTAPIGVLAAHRVFDVVLPHSVEVAPRTLAVTWLPSPAPVEGGLDEGALAGHSGDLVRSVRPYVGGDPPQLVHWPSTARLGQLVVRELEPPVPVGQAVVVDLRDLGSDTERAAAFAMGACRAVLGAGGDLVLATCETGGPVVGRVRTVLDAGRRLARAVPGPPGVPPEGWPVVEIGA